MVSDMPNSPPPPKTLRARVVARRMLAPRVLSLELAVESDAVFRYCAGQYIRIHLDDGRRRDLSIATPCEGNNLLETWVRDVGGDFSRYLFDQLEPGERWTLDGPLGDAWVRASDEPLLVISGGTGLGPARAIVRAELTRDPTRPIELIHGDTASTDLFAEEELEHWAREHPSFTYLPTLDNAEAQWSGHHGTPDKLLAARHEDLQGWTAHVFGPPPMVEAVAPVLEARGIERDAIHADMFTPGASDLDRIYPPSG